MKFDNCVFTDLPASKTHVKVGGTLKTTREEAIADQGRGSSYYCKCFKNNSWDTRAISFEIPLLSCLLSQRKSDNSNQHLFCYFTCIGLETLYQVTPKNLQDF